MYLYWLGESSFKIKTENGTTIIIDPADKATGLPQTTIMGDVVLISHALPCDLGRVKSEDAKRPSFIIDGAGEYEIQGIFVYGVSTFENKLIYLIKVDDISIAHLSNLQGELTDKQLELFEGADIALVPVGGHGVLTSKEADSVVSQIEPSLVIPANYCIPKLLVPRDNVDPFLGEMGVKGLTPETSLYTSKPKLPQEETQVVLLSPG